MNRRFCLTLDLKDDPKLIAEYKRYHEKIWVVGCFEKGEKMKVFWLEGGLHCEPETKEERSALALLLNSVKVVSLESSEESTVGTSVGRQQLNKSFGANS